MLNTYGNDLIEKKVKIYKSVTKIIARLIKNSDRQIFILIASQCENLPSFC